MTAPEQAQPKPLMYPVVMSQQSMVSPSAGQYPVLMQPAQNMMYMVQSQYKKEDDYRQYQGPPPPMAGHSLYIGHTGYTTAAYPPSQLYYPPVYMAPPQMQAELPPPPGPPEMYMPEPLNLSVAPPKEVMLPPPVLVNPETSILQPNAPAFLPTSYHQVQAKPPATFNSNLQLRPNAPAFQPPPQEVIKQEQLEPEPCIVVSQRF